MANPAKPVPKVINVTGSGTAAPLYVMRPRIRLASGLDGELIGVDGSSVMVNVPAVGELNVKVVVAQFTEAPDAPVVIVPDNVAVYTPGLGEPSLGKVKFTLSVKVAPVTVLLPVEVALKTPSVMLED